MSAQLLWPDLEPEAIESGWLVEVPPLTSDQVLEAVARRHPMTGFGGRPGRWVFVREVDEATGTYSGVQRFDAVAVGLVPSVKYARVVYEIKISRGDWLRELKPITDVADASSGYRLSSHVGNRALRVQGAREDPRYRVTDRRKWDAALAISTEFWYAAPPRCILVDELPPEAGLLEVRAWGRGREFRARVVRPAPVRQTPIPDPSFWAAILRRAAER
jgi:hypothetical protein